MVFKALEKYGEHEEVVFVHNKDVGLKGIIAIHNTALGPALGGLRMWNYASEEEALVDVLRLSKGMTYKAAAADLNLGGGKAVIIGDPKTQKSEGLFRYFGAFVNSLNGLYITAEDVGTTIKDMEYIFMETPYVTGIPESFGGSGDPSPHTAYGVLRGIKAAVKEKLGLDTLEGLRVAVQGLGHVGSHLVEHLVRENAIVTVADVDSERVKKISELYKLKSLPPEDIVTSECDIFSPCALGAVIHEKNISDLKCKIIAGAANNQLKETFHAKALKELDILYAPDYVINAGGLINVFVELEGYSRERAMQRTKCVYENLMHVFKISKDCNISTDEAAQKLAENRLKSVSNLRSHHQGRVARVFANLKEMKNRSK